MPFPTGEVLVTMRVETLFKLLYNTLMSTFLTRSYGNISYLGLSIESRLHHLYQVILYRAIPITRQDLGLLVFTLYLLPSEVVIFIMYNMLHNE